MTSIKNIIFAGTPLFSAVTLQALIDSPHNILAVYTQPDRPSGRGQKLTASPVKELALQHHLPVFQPVSLKSVEEQERLKKFNADLMIVVAYGLILPKAVLDIPKRGCLNIHASLLPRWRGAAPIQRAIEAGDTETGITIMQMDPGLDTGPMLHKAICPIAQEDTSETLHNKLAQLGREAMLLTLNHLDDLQPVIQNQAHATYAAKITKEEARIDWAQSSIEIDRMIRAFNPWPVAYTEAGKNVLRIWEARKVECEHSANPGEILKSESSQLLVATGKGVLQLLKIQLPGGRVLPVADVLHAHHPEFSLGQTLG